MFKNHLGSDRLGYPAELTQIKRTICVDPGRASFDGTATDSTHNRINLDCIRANSVKTKATLLLVLFGTMGFSVLSQGATLTGAVEIWEPASPQPVKLKTHRDAVIFVTGFNEPPPPGRHPHLVQKNKQFTRRVLVITQSEVVEFPNHDPIYHNVWSRSRAKTFDLGLFRHPETRPVQFLKLGIVTVFCNIHANMIASILVLPNNKYAISDATGNFRVEGIPPGKHTVYAWVEGAKPIKRDAVFRDANTLNLYFKLLLRRVPIRHLNKDGKPYKKYSN